MNYCYSSTPKRTATDDLGYETITYFDARGLKSEVHLPCGTVHRYFYDERGLLSLQPQ